MTMMFNNSMSMRSGVNLSRFQWNPDVDRWKAPYTLAPFTCRLWREPIMALELEKKLHMGFPLIGLRTGPATFLVEQVSE
jgi:hypothetical protein